MKRLSLLMALSILLACPVLAQLNITQLGKLAYAQDLADVWGYATPTGEEYALVGVLNGLSVVDVTNPTTPNQVAFIPGANSIWRDIKTWNNHAYVTNESSGGLLIVDLSPLPSGSITSWTFYTGSTYPFQSAHNLFIDENGVAYIFGADNGNGGAIMLDLTTDPMNPVELGRFNTYYAHDGVVRGDTMWIGCINDGFAAVVDVSNKSNPTVWQTWPTPNNTSHNCWFSDNNNYLFTTDEVSDAYVVAYDVSNLSNITETDRYQSSPGQNVIPHNTHWMNDFLITSYYRDGVTIVDASYPQALVEVGNFDTSPLFSGNGYNGAWGAYPWLPSGNLLVSDIEEGLYVLGPTYVHASYLNGQVTDQSNGSPLGNVQVSILTTTAGTTTDLAGNYMCGYATAGTYDVQYSLSGYLTHTETNVVLSSNNITTVNVQLIPLLPFTLNGQVLEQSTGNPISGARVRFENQDFTFDTITDASGNFSFNAFYEGSYTFSAGKWGYRTQCQSVYVDANTGSVTAQLPDGYYDDFAWDFNWSVSGNATTGIWARGEPVGTVYNSTQANPEYDVSTDCSVQAYVTGNGGGGPGTDDVDGGYTYLSSPVMDLSTYSNPVLYYKRWFFNDGGSGTPNDSLKVWIDNGSTQVLAETVVYNTPNNSSWQQNSVQISSLIPVTSTMQVVFETMDVGGGHLVEAGVDQFEIVDQAPPVASFSASQNTACAGGCITFSDQSTNVPTSWSWTFPGGTPAGATSANPVICYNSAGSYDVTLIASNAYGADTLSMTAYIAVYDPAISISATGVDCNGNSSGAATATVSTALNPLTYQWSNSGNSASISSIAAGNYCLTVTDAASCSSVQCVTITEPTALSAAASVNNATCGNSDGSASVTVTGGVTPYNYLWSTGATGAGVSGLSSGTYILTVTDANGCQDIQTVNINDQGGPSLSLLASNDALCNGNCDGSAQISAVSGTPPYTYQWPSGDTTVTENALCAGSYIVTVSDSNACNAMLTVVISEPAALGISDSIINTTQGNCDGSAYTAVTGGTAPYSYQWSTGNNTGSDTALCAGNYTVTVTDANGCSIVDTVAVGSTIGIDDADIPLKISLFPNPGREGFYLKSSASKALRVSVFSNDGRLVFRKTATEGRGTHFFSPPLCPGSYFVVVDQGSGHAVLSWLKL